MRVARDLAKRSPHLNGLPRRHQSSGCQALRELSAEGVFDALSARTGEGPSFIKERAGAYARLVWVARCAVKTVTMPSAHAQGDSRMENITARVQAALVPDATAGRHRDAIFIRHTTASVLIVEEPGIRADTQVLSGLLFSPILAGRQ